MRRVPHTLVMLVMLAGAPAHAQEDTSGAARDGVQADDGVARDADQARRPSPGWSLRPSGGFGVGSRSVDLPADGLVQRTRTGPFPAFDVGLELDYAASPAITTGLLVRYQSSLGGLGIDEPQVGGTTQTNNLRAHRLELALAPTLFLDDAQQWALSASVGYANRNLRAERHGSLTPSYSLAGPHARLELRLPLGHERLHLRLGPELHWLLAVGAELQDRRMSDSGFALGGEASVELELSIHFALRVGYREMHSTLAAPADQPGSFSDVERFGTARLVGSL